MCKWVWAGAFVCATCVHHVSLCRFHQDYLRGIMYIYKCIRIYINICICIYVYIYTYMYMCLYFFIDLYIISYTHTHSHLHIRVYRYTQTYTRMNIQTQMHTHIYIQMSMTSSWSAQKRALLGCRGQSKVRVVPQHPPPNTCYSTTKSVDYAFFFKCVCECTCLLVDCIFAHTLIHAHAHA